jgi:ubiquinone/menaquinone biosynthesis C-methylase UbiE
MHYRLHFCVADEFILNGGRGLVLDVGAGTGALAEQLIKRADLILDATDISKEMLEIAKLKNIYNRSFLSDLTKEIPVTDDYYDGVVSSGTFTHGHVGPSSMRELVRVTKPAGLITISVNEKHWTALDFNTELENISKSVKNYTLKKIDIYGEQSVHDHKDDKAIILTINV